MKIVKAVVVSVFLLFSSCTSNVELIPVNYSSLFNDENSKVWIVNKVVYDSAVISPVDNIDKSLMIFYYNNHCDFIALKNLGRKPAIKGFYNLNSRTKHLDIQFDEELWDFTLAYIYEDSILLQPTEKSKFQFSIQLKPFPEL